MRPAAFRVRVSSSSSPRRGSLQRRGTPAALGSEECPFDRGASGIKSESLPRNFQGTNVSFLLGRSVGIGSAACCCGVEEPPTSATVEEEWVVL
ncbi:hypothetical protein GRJ2_002218700 [Grus japonensis]|uniref:Uncharacterized protein n=1 Tax=Grus japonensis TaxID=30415 RepID=A0ABC9XIM3_GRUJA